VGGRGGGGGGGGEKKLICTQDSVDGALSVKAVEQYDYVVERLWEWGVRIGRILSSNVCMGGETKFLRMLWGFEERQGGL
jgi:hypothetical protein